MSSIFRASRMCLVQLYIPSEAAQTVVYELGELGLLQFNDLNSHLSAFQREFVNDIRRLHEMERQIRLLIEQAERADVMVRSWFGLATSASIGHLALAAHSRTPQELDELQAQLNEHEERIQSLEKNQKDLQARYEELCEWRAALEVTATFLEDEEGDDIRPEALLESNESAETDSIILEDDIEVGHIAAKTTSPLGFLVGVITRKRLPAFERVLWRALRGNLYLRAADIENLMPNGAPKSAFIVFAHGEATLGKAHKICESLGARLYQVEAEHGKRQTAMLELIAKIDDVNTVLFNTTQTQRGELAKVAESLEGWLLLVRKQKAVYDALNKMNHDSGRRCLIAEGWVAHNDVPSIESALHSSAELAGHEAVPVLAKIDAGSRHPPTHFPTNKFTRTFQEIVDAYGVARYGEINPALFTITSFPFLFAVMFGDIGHALVLTVVAAVMIIFERRIATKPQGEISGMMFSGRYIILLMGLFSLYMGLLYNDIFSKTISLFPSMWKTGPNNTLIRRGSSYVYPFGLDPAWPNATNAMVFSNSYKMKQAILFGVLQMLFGLCLSALNQNFLGDTLDVFCVFVPQMLFMLSLFGYLSGLIIFKWIAGRDASLLTTFITMVLRFGAVEGKPLYAGQHVVQTLLLLVAIMCVPWMLFAKPLVLYMRMRQIRAAGYDITRRESQEPDVNVPAPAPAKPNAATEHPTVNHVEESISDVIVFQALHTIEFVLGSVSNTASYLRLWALSLAHAQLSEVLWHMVIDTTIRWPFALVPGYALWFTFTLAIMVAMEGLSAFLHALRLHWVEFNNKFYSGTGTKFEPFSFETVLAEPEE